MKRTLLGLASAALLFTACQEDQNEAITQDQTPVDMSDFYTYTYDNEAGRVDGKGKTCYSMQVLNRQLEENPGLHNKMFNIEKAARQFISAKKPDGAGGGKPGNGGGDGGGGTDPVDDGLGTISIPVYVHVIYNTSQQNISLAQIESQIRILNEDFGKTNGDVNNTPAEFAGTVADSDISFTLAGVTRTETAKTSWGTNDAMKKSSMGGVDPVTPETHLNIWVCEIGGGILGYAQFPGGSASTDGVVIAPQYFGDTGYVSAPFDKGRTGTHEVGHYLNLRHIWGDGRCRQDDFVADTPTADSPNYSCPSYPSVSCKSNDMTMNYMDYTNDACMYMFTEGQKARMRAIFASGGPRSTML